MVTLDNTKIPEGFKLKLDHEITCLQLRDKEQEIARVLILDDIFDSATQDYLLAYVEDFVRQHGDSGLLYFLRLRTNSDIK